MIKLADEMRCTGCRSCIQVCPVGAVDFVPDVHGVALPHIDLQKCISCRKCQKACPVFTPVKRNTAQECFAAWALSESDRKGSASGGIAYTLSAQIIGQGGVVFGAAFTPDGTLVHKKAACIQELELFRNSKYVQSNIENTFAETQELLQAGVTVLFTGTPCQIAGLYGYLGGHPENLFTVDLVCHGVPPSGIWQEYLSGFRVKTFSALRFRNGHSYCLEIPEKKYKRFWQSDPYYFSFMHGISFRENCFQCPYANMERTGDITLGDFWGLNKNTLHNFPPGAVSLVLLNTEAGRRLFAENSGRLYFEKRDLTEAAAGNGQLRNPFFRHPARASFWQSYRPGNLHQAFEASGIKRLVRRNLLKYILKTPFRIIRDWLKGI